MLSCLVNLFGRVEFGHVLVVGGTSSSDCKTFKISLKDDEDQPLVILVDFRMMQIVVSSYVDSEWGEAKKIDAEEKLKPGDDFQFYIFKSDYHYHVSLGKLHLCSFGMPEKQSNIKALGVSGDLDRIFQVDHRCLYPWAWPPIQEDLPTIGFSSDVPYQFSPGSVIVIKMKVFGATGGSFFVRFNDRATKKQLFHFNPRFYEKLIVVNSMNDKLLWLEDKHRYETFPFEFNKDFVLAIGLASSCFKVAANGRHLLTYDFKSTKQALPKAFTGHHPIFEKLTGFKIFGLMGMQVQVSLVDHTLTRDDCVNYEILSSPNFTS